VKTIAFAAAVALLVSSMAHAQVRIEISGANFRPLPIAAPAPLAQGVPNEATSQFDSALMLDLTASGIFQLLDRKSYLADPKEGITAGTIRFQRWSDVGADVLLKTQLSSSGGELRAQARLFNVATGREELQIAHSVPLERSRQLAHHIADELYRHFTREPGPFQSHLAYVTRSGGSREVWFSDWDGMNAKRISNGGINLLPTVAPDGLRVAFTSYNGGQPDLYVHRPGNGKPTPIVRAGAMATGVAFSPDGRRIAWAQSSGQGTQIWVAQSDGSGSRAITETPFFINTSPSWSPDGRQLAFVSDRGGSPQIYVMNADGGGVRRLTFQGNYNQTPDWSPRGDLIAFTARDERNAFDLFTVDVNSGKITRLTQDQGNNEEPSFAPNGRLIVFTSARNGWPQLFVMTYDGRNQVPLPLSRGAYLTPDWGP
jgi:TolB protein